MLVEQMRRKPDSRANHALMASVRLESSPAEAPRLQAFCKHRASAAMSLCSAEMHGRG
jgi:hypothetical protein